MRTEEFGRGSRECKPWSENPIAPGCRIAWRMVFSFLEQAVDCWEAADAALRRRELDRRRAAALLAIREERESAVEMARKTGGALAALKHVEGSRGWVRDVRAMGMSEGSAVQRVALWYFAKNWPTIYYRCRFLGLTKVFKIVRALDEVVAKLFPDHVVDGRGRTVGQLTDSNYRDYVNGLLRAKRRPVWERAVRDVRDVERTALQLTASDIPQGATVAELQSRLTAATVYLAALAPP